ncbi:MAG: MHS family MFS transporter, partial [Mesorhizobium sp.]
LTKNSVPYDVVTTAAPGTAATVKIGNETVDSYDAVAAGDQAKAKEAVFQKAVNMSLRDGGYPLKRAAAKVPDQKLDAFIAANPELKLDAAAIRGGEKTTVPADKAVTDKLLTKDEAAGAPEITVYSIPGGGPFAMVADPAAVNWPMTIGILFILVVFVTMVYGPIAAILVEMFPTRIRYTGMSLPYHIGNGWFGGLLPATVFALSAYKGDIYYGLWYPVVIAAMSLIIGMIFVRDTLGTDLH